MKVSDIKYAIARFPIFSKRKSDFSKTYKVFSSKYLASDPIKKMENDVLKEIGGNAVKKKMFIDHLKKYLATNELDYLSKNTDDIDAVFRSLISKFIYMDTEETEEKNRVNNTINEISSKILDLYVEAIEHFEMKMEDIFALTRKINQTICRFIIMAEKLKDVKTESNISNIEILQYKGLIPKNIVIAMLKLETRPDFYNYQELKDNYVDRFIETHLYNLDIVVKWFIKKYININYSVEQIENYLNDNPVEHLTKWDVMDAYDAIKLHFRIKDFVYEGLHPHIRKEKPLDEQKYTEKNNGFKKITQPKWYLIPVFDDEFERIKSGDISDNDINIDMVPVLIPGVYNSFFLEVYLGNLHETNSGRDIFLKNIAISLEKLIEKGIFEKQICASARENNIKILLEDAKLHYCTTNKDNVEIYCVDVKDILNLPFYEDFIDLKSKYKSMNLL